MSSARFSNRAPRTAPWVRFLAQYGHAYLFISPFFVLFTIFLLFPILYSFYLSFHAWNGILEPRWVGLANYWRALNDAQFLRALANTALFTGISVTLTTAGALAMALMLNSVRTLRTFFRGVFFLPSIVSLVVVSIVWKILLNSQIGLLPETLEALRSLITSITGTAPAWLSETNHVRLLDSSAHAPAIPALSVPLLTLILINFWAGVGFSTVIYLAGLQSIPTQLYEAAIMDGANRTQCLWHITIPMLQPTTFFVVIMGTIDALQVFVLPNVMTRDSEATMSVVYFLFRQAFEYQRMGYASAVAYILFFLTVALGYLLHRWLGRNRGWSRSEAE
jgi:ABC-type sugar transport system permease subunit